MKPILVAVASWLALLALTGCESAATAQHGTASPSFIALERTAGFGGEGPVYVVTLLRDGRVVFEGHAHVKHKGTFTKNIPAERAAALFTQVEVLNLWERAPRYDTEHANRGGDDIIVRTAPAEAAWDILTVRDRGRFKRIDGFFYAPSELVAFKAAIERAVGLAEWVGPPAAGQAR